MSDNKIELSGIFSEGYGINPKKLWRLKIGIYKLNNGKTVKSIYIKSVLSYMLSYTGAGNECFPAIKTISDDLEINRNIVINAINAACELGMIRKEQMYPNDPLKHNNKYILDFLKFSNQAVDVQKSKLTCSDGSTFEVYTLEQNNNSINNNNINNNKKKHKYGDKVKLSDKEYNDLTNKYTESLVKKKIDSMNDYLVMHGKTYKDYYRALNNWLKKDAEKKAVSDGAVSFFGKCPKCGLGLIRSPEKCYDCGWSKKEEVKYGVI